MTPFSQMSPDEKRTYKRKADKRCKARKKLLAAGEPIPPELEKMTPAFIAKKREPEILLVVDDGPLIAERYEDGCRLGFNPDTNNGLLNFKIKGLEIWFECTAALVYKNKRMSIEMNAMSRDQKNRSRFVKSYQIWTRDITDLIEQLRTRNFIKTVQPITAKFCKSVIDGETGDFLKMLLEKAENKSTMKKMLQACASSSTKDMVAKVIA